MQIKRIDLIGFKSFCEKMSLDFRQRITGIVGPNGCGKSNVVDALRWAMGEQSARHLRGKVMEDVIFNGSDSRGPSGMAEVSITFENDGLVPVEYLDYSEITISRRLYRDGTSEYLINKVPVRLRDITDVFLGTGVGTKAYSIIEQGRIGLIVSARPEDRRHFIEEAAGITKFQRRKKAAERKMDATQQNLLRVKDVLDEMHKRLGSLRRQAKKAERYKAYRTEMRDIDLWTSSHRLLANIAEQKFIDNTLLQLEQEQITAKNSLEEQEGAMERARALATEEERQVSSLQEQLYSLENHIKLNENNIQFHSHEADELEHRAEEAQREVEELGRQLLESDSQLTEFEQKLNEVALNRTVLAEQLTARSEVLAQEREKVTEARKALEQERNSLAQVERSFARTEANLRAMNQRRKDMQEQLEKRREEVNRVVDRIANLRTSERNLDGELDNLRLSVEKMDQDRGEIKARLEALAEVARKGESEIEVLRTELHRRRSRLASLKEIHQRYEGFSRGTRAIMQKHNGTAKEKGILGLVADVLEAPATYEMALEAVLGQRLGTIIVEDNQVGLDAIEFLKTSAEGRSSFIPKWAKHGILENAPVGFIWKPQTNSSSTMTAVTSERAHPIYSAEGVHGPILKLIRYNKDYQRVAESLLSDVVVVESLDRALELWEVIEDKTLVTLGGEILSQEGVLTGGSQDAEQSGFLRQKREIKELTDIITELEEQYDAALDAHVKVKSEIASLKQIVEDITRKGHQGDKDIITREKDLSRIHSEIEALSLRMKELETEIDKLHTTLDQMDGQEADLKQELFRSSEDKHLLGDIIFLLQREEHRLSVFADAAGSEVTDVKVALAHAEGTCRSIEDHLRRLKEGRRDKSERIVKLESNRADSLNRVNDLKIQVEKIQEELKELVASRTGVQEKFNQYRAQYEARLAEVGDLETQLKQVRKRTGELTSEVGKLRIRVSELSMARCHLEEQIWDKYRERLVAVAGDYHLRGQVSEQESARLNQLRDLIEKMGEINLMAIEEFEELNGRYEFLAKHKDDLENALGQLQRAIQKINRTSKKRFKETFDLVNAKFQEVFPRLFKGGRAKLMLTDEENLLETGVEIISQPPGKKLQSIDLLSGGEKALTAVSLIFAMFLVKPTPFCLLDEVDAPLDEANVSRFNDMVREMSNNSQFIIITHNRRTMEIADRLYGVTMEEPGVSKLVSVNLSSQQAAAA